MIESTEVVGLDHISWDKANFYSNSGSVSLNHGIEYQDVQWVNTSVANETSQNK
jgi:hypothetical protein